MKTTKFIIVCIQRSGSTWLTTLLNSHPDICCAEETFLLSRKNMCPMSMRKKIWPHKLGYPRYINSSIKRCLKHHFLRTKSINEYLNQFYSMPDYSAIGFKIMLNQIEKFSTTSDYFFKNDVKVIHLVRDNILKTFISRISVSQKKVAHTQKKLKFTKIHIPTEKIETKLQKIKNDNKALEKLFFQSRYYLKIIYEDLLKDIQAESKKIFNFLDINKSTALSSPLVKINSGKLKDIIENYDEIERCLNKTPYEQYLY